MTALAPSPVAIPPPLPNGLSIFIPCAHLQRSTVLGISPCKNARGVHADSLT